MIYLKYVFPQLCYILISAPFSTASEDEVSVTIPQGTLRGSKEVSVFGDVFYSFQAIPYAKAPVGELRFKPPQPVEKWTGIRDATKTGNNCPGIDIWTLQMVQNASEDCLFLNVFTKEIPKPGKKYPVMVYIHGGGYNFDYVNRYYFSPDYLMAYDIIFIHFTYRLGALGFLSLLTLELPGNNGLKDQSFALKWIQDNIIHFGGDPDKVTLFGESAGAGAVHYHILSPTSRGLFQKAICMSAVSNNFWGYQYHPREYAYFLGKRLGCNAKSDKELLDFLKKASPTDLVMKTVGILHELKEQRSYETIANVTFVPAIEPEHEGAFLTKIPLTGDYQADIPLLIGNNDKEFILEIYSPKVVPKWKEDKEFQELIPRNFRVERDSEKSVEIARRIRQFYFKDGKMALDGYVDVLSDVYFNHGINRAIKHRLDNDKIKSPTYRYLFSFDGNCPYLKTFLETVRGTHFEVKGAAHADELTYLFGFHRLKNCTMKVGSPEHKTMLRLTQLWVSFATTGVPTIEKSEIKWPPLKTTDDVYLEIGNELQLKKGVFKERMKFWDEIYEFAGEKL